MDHGLGDLSGQFLERYPAGLGSVSQCGEAADGPSEEGIPEFLELGGDTLQNIHEFGVLLKQLKDFRVLVDLHGVTSI